MRNGLIAITVLPVLMLGGCPAPYTDIERSVEASAPADFYCLLEQLREFADGRAVTYTVQDLSGGTTHAVRYIRSGLYYSWIMLVRPGQSVTITHRSGVKDSHPQDLPVVWQNMLAVETNLRDQCGLGDVMDAARTSCQGKACNSVYWPPDKSLERAKGE